MITSTPGLPLLYLCHPSSKGWPPHPTQGQAPIKIIKGPAPLCVYAGYVRAVIQHTISLLFAIIIFGAEIFMSDDYIQITKPAEVHRKVLFVAPNLCAEVEKQGKWKKPKNGGATGNRSLHCGFSFHIPFL